MTQLLHIPYKPLTRCSIDELAVQQQINERLQRSTGGVMFARKDYADEHAGKAEARRAVRDLFTLDAFPGHLSLLTMPGLNWRLEASLLKHREPNWRNQPSVSTVRFTCVENDRFVYYSAITKMPGNRHCGLRTLTRPVYGERAMGNGIVDTFAFANVDDLMREGDEAFDAAWLDYTGPLSLERMRLIAAFWQQRVRHTLIVTALKARWNKATGDRIARHGGCLNWMRAALPGHVVHAIEYQDGPSPMVQLAISKAKGRA